MENIQFTEEEIRYELANFGYSNLPNETITQFKKDLEKLMILNSQAEDSGGHVSTSSKNLREFSNEKENSNINKSIKRKVSQADALPMWTMSNENGLLSFKDIEASSERSSSFSNNQIKRKVCRPSTRTSQSDDSIMSEILSILDGDELLPARALRSTPQVRAEVSSTSSVIKLAGSNQYKNKCDPVKKYHEYKRYWDEFPTPGEEKRNQLRWGIRERMYQVGPVSSKFDRS